MSKILQNIYFFSDTNPLLDNGTIFKDKNVPYIKALAEFDSEDPYRGDLVEAILKNVYPLGSLLFLQAPIERSGGILLDDTNPNNIIYKWHEMYWRCLPTDDDPEHNHYLSCGYVHQDFQNPGHYKYYSGLVSGSFLQTIGFQGNNLVKNHTLTVNEMPSHNHVIEPSVTPYTQPTTTAKPGKDGSTVNIQEYQVTTFDHSHTCENNGFNQPHNHSFECQDDFVNEPLTYQLYIYARIQ